MTVSEAVGGSKREALEAVRDRLAAELDGERLCPSCKGPTISNTAAVAKQLVDVLERLDGLAVPQGSAVDDLAKRRRARRGEAGSSDDASAGVKRGAGNGGARRKRGASS